jgi:hypothetical protein
MAAALEMLVIENRAADNRKVAVAADEEMREEIDEIQKASRVFGAISIGTCS